MITVITVIILLACVVLGFFILVQNPKGGGLSGSFGSIGSQVMGVKQSTDVMEKGTWTTMGIVAALCIVSVVFFIRPSKQDVAPTGKQKTQQPASNGGQQQAPAAPAK